MESAGSAAFVRGGPYRASLLIRGSVRGGVLCRRGHVQGVLMKTNPGYLWGHLPVPAPRTPVRLPGLLRVSREKYFNSRIFVSRLKRTPVLALVSRLSSIQPWIIREGFALGFAQEV
jgi:hypothetical protein